MVICKNCQHETVYTGEPCPVCKQRFTFDKEDLKSRLAALEYAKRSKQFEQILESCHILADAGHTDSEVEFASILEKGHLTERNLDLAMNYYYRAAKKHNAYAAFKYSRLAGRTNDSVGRFWLIYSAVLGCSRAYPEVAEEFSALGYEEDAHYFYYLAAACDDTFSIVTLAKRFYTGVGVSPSPEYAKWCMDKLTIPPIYAIKLAYKLRSVTPKEPPVPTLKNYDGLLKKLALQANNCNFSSAYFKLSEILASRGDTEYSVTSGNLLIQGVGCEKNVSEGLKLLTKAAALKNTSALVALGDFYYYNDSEKNINLALNYYNRAGELGAYKAYETIGDIYFDVDNALHNISTAVHYYDLASELGSLNAKSKADKIKNERKMLFNLAIEEERVNPKKASSLYMSSAKMGSSDAMMRLAELSRLGIGVKKSRKNTFLWYKAAAKAGALPVLYPLGICYARGYGTRLDFGKAKDVLEKAEKSGDSRAHAKIISMLDNKVKKTAKSLYSSAMRLVYLKKFDTARSYLEVSAELNYPKAIYALGCFYEFGVSIPCDRDMAFSLYEKAHSLSFFDYRSVYKLAILKSIKRQK